MSLHEDSDLDGGEIPLDANVTEDLRIHLMSIKGANKKLCTKVEDMSANIAGVEDRLNVRLTTSDRQRDDSLRVVTKSLNRMTAAVQRLEARDATPRQSRSPRRNHHHSDADVSDLSDARGGYQRRAQRGVEVPHVAGDEDTIMDYADFECLSWKEILSLIDDYYKVNSFLVEKNVLISPNYILPDTKMIWGGPIFS
jgi:hypothetical protein